MAITNITHAAPLDKGGVSNANQIASEARRTNWQIQTLSELLAIAAQSGNLDASLTADAVRMIEELSDRVGVALSELQEIEQ